MDTKSTAKQQQSGEVVRDSSRHFKPKAFLSLVASITSLRVMFNQFLILSIHNVRCLPLAFLPSILPSSARDSILSLRMKWPKNLHLACANLGCVYTVPVQFRSSAGTQMFLFPGRYKIVPNSRYKVVSDHFI